MMEKTIERRIFNEMQVKEIHEKLAMFPANTEISVALIKNCVVEFYGAKNDNGTIVEVENNKSIFEIGSISKVFTSTILANLALESVLDLDDDVNEYLNFKLNNDFRFTFKQLANHTAGLPSLPSSLVVENTKNPYADYDNNRLEDYLKNEREETPNWDFTSALVGAGGILSNVEDLSKFVLAQFDEENKDLKLTREKTFTANEHLQMGLGWLNSGTKYYHTGGTGGYTSIMLVDTEAKNGVVVLTNVPSCKETDEINEKSQLILLLGQVLFKLISS